MKLSILTEDPGIVAICGDNWSVSEDGFIKTVATIAAEHSMSSYDLSKVVKKYSAAYSEVRKCRSCDTPYRYTSRSDYSTSKISVDWICENCQTEERLIEKQRVDEKRRQDEQMLSSILDSTQSYFLDQHADVEILDVREAVYLLALIRHSMSEDLSHLKPYSSNRNERLGMDLEHDREIVTNLYQSEKIYISPDSNKASFELVSETQFRFGISEVQWKLVIGDSVQPSQYIAQLENKVKSMDFLESHYEETKALSEEIALKECLFYLDHVLNEHQIPFKPGEKTKHVLSTGLHSFSVAQMYNFIWRAAKDAASFHLRKKVAKKHAANTVVGNIDSQIERALSNNWDVKPYRRNYDYPQSMVSRVLYNLLLHTDDGGFNQLISKLI